MFGLGQWEILLVLLVVLLLFGARRIPDMAQGLGKGIKEFRKAVREVQEEVDTSTRDAAPGPSIGGTVASQPSAAASPPPQPSVPEPSVPQPPVPDPPVPDAANKESSQS